jgi:hypothetical protein
MRQTVNGLAAVNRLDKGGGKLAVEISLVSRYFSHPLGALITTVSE